MKSHGTDQIRLVSTTLCSKHWSRTHVLSQGGSAQVFLPLDAREAIPPAVSAQHLHVFSDGGHQVVRSKAATEFCDCLRASCLKVIGSQCHLEARGCVGCFVTHQSLTFPFYDIRGTTSQIALLPVLCLFLVGSLRPLLGKLHQSRLLRRLRAVKGLR